MSWSTRFTEKKNEDGWQTVGGGRSVPQPPITNSAFAAAGGSGGGGAGGGGGGWGAGRTYGGFKKPAPPPPTVDLGSDKDFPSLGGGGKAAAAIPKATGFAALASAWADKDADERAVAAAEAARCAAAHAEELKAAAARDNRIMSHIFRPKVQVATVAMYDDEEVRDYGDDLDADAYGRRGRSPPYDPNPDYEGEAPATEEGDNDWSMKE
jgi:hypothetical protein